MPPNTSPARAAAGHRRPRSAGVVLLGGGRRALGAPGPDDRVSAGPAGPARPGPLPAARYHQGDERAAG